MLETQITQCPYCWESIELVIDQSVPEQEYIEDCEVCCRPIRLLITVDDGEAYVTAMHEDE
jgi:hypothetical protein